MIGKEANGRRDRVGRTRCTVQSHRARVSEIGLDPRISIQASGRHRCRRTNRPDRRQHLTAIAEPIEEMLAFTGASIDDRDPNGPRHRRWLGSPRGELPGILWLEGEAANRARAWKAAPRRGRLPAGQPRTEPANGATGPASRSAPVTIAAPEESVRAATL